MIKYAIEPVYTTTQKEDVRVRLLYGYIVSKCYVIDKNTVLFPYVVYNPFVETGARKKIDARIGYNTTYVNNIYDNYQDAKDECTLMNELVSTDGLKNSTKKRLSHLEKMIDELNKELHIKGEVDLKYNEHYRKQISKKLTDKKDN